MEVRIHDKGVEFKASVGKDTLREGLGIKTLKLLGIRKSFSALISR